MKIDCEKSNCVICGSDYSRPIACGEDYLYKTCSNSFTFVCCNTCGHIYLNPRPVASAVDIIYPKQYASFSRRFSEKRSVIALIKEMVLLSRFNLLSGYLPETMKLIDIGCGDGEFLCSLRKRYPKAELYGLDWHFSEETIREMEKARVQPIKGLFENVILRPGYHDVILMNQLLEHLWDPTMGIKKCHEAMKEGGLLAIETPNPDGYDRKYLFHDGAWGSYYYPRHLNLFTKKGLNRFLVQAGFVIEKHISLLAPICWVYTMISLNKRKKWNMKVIDKFFRDTNPIPLMLFSAIDLMAKVVGFNTSNQKVVARKVSIK